MIKKPRLVNAQSVAEENPDTFEVPTIDELLSVVVGSYVKVCPNTAPGERFWVEVTEISEDRKDFTGRISNDLELTVVHGLSRGEFITLSPENIYALERPTRRKYAPAPDVSGRR